MIVAQAAFFVHLSLWFAGVSLWTVIPVVVGVVTLAMGLYKFFKERREAKRSPERYKKRWRDELTKARVSNPNLVLTKPAMQKGDDPEIYDLAWAEFDKEQIAGFMDKERWDKPWRDR